MLAIVKTYTLEEFEAFIALPENRSRDFEYIGGEIIEVVAHPKSSKFGALMVTFLGMYLLKNDIGHLTGADGGYWVAGERYIPDAAFIRYSRQPVLLSEDGYNPEAPDLAVEVLSPTNTTREIRIKLANYRLAGTLVWLLDPEAQTVEVYAPDAAARLLRRGDRLDGGALLPGFTLEIDEMYKKE